MEEIKKAKVTKKVKQSVNVVEDVKSYKSDKTELLKKVVNETANASIAISVNEKDGFFTVIGNTQRRINHQDFQLLCGLVIDFITTNRKEKEVSNRSPKPYTL